MDPIYKTTNWSKQKIQLVARGFKFSIANTLEKNPQYFQEYL